MKHFVSLFQVLKQSEYNFWADFYVNCWNLIWTTIKRIGFTWFQCFFWNTNMICTFFFPHYLWDPYVWKIFFCILYHVLPVSVYMNETNSFMCCYDISAVALSECLALCNLSSGVIFKYYHLQCPKCHGLDAPFCKWCYMVLVLKYL